MDKRIQSLFQSMSDSAVHCGWVLEAVGADSFILHQDKDRVPFRMRPSMKLEGAIDLWEGTFGEDFDPEEVLPITLHRCTALMILGMLLRFRIYDK